MDDQEIRDDPKPGDTFIKKLLDALDPQPWGMPERIMIGSIFFFGVANLVLIGLVLLK